MAVYDKRFLDEARAFMGFDGNKRNASGTIIGTYTEQEYQTVSNSERNRWRRTLATRNGVDYDSVTYVFGSRDSVDGFIDHVNDTNNNFHLGYLREGDTYNGNIWTDLNNYHATQPGTSQFTTWQTTIQNKLQNTTYWGRYWANADNISTATYPITKATNGTFANGQGNWQAFNPGRWAGIDCAGLVQLSAIRSGVHDDITDTLGTANMDGIIPYDHPY